MAVSSVIFFLLFLLGVALCCHLFRCFVECLCRWADYWYEKEQEEAFRQTQVVPRDIFIKPVPPVKKYIVVVNPQGHPMSLGLPKEYSNV